MYRLSSLRVHQFALNRSLLRVFSTYPESAVDAAGVTLHAAGKSFEGGLYLVATPIGNLDDITLRALKVLKAADAVFAEDTRHTVKLLRHFDISPPELLSYHEHNRRSKEEEILQRVRDGKVVALVSDAGTPAISDPGADVVAAAAKEGLNVVPVPGASAALAALVASGLPTSHFYFFGFLPPKTAQRQEALTQLNVRSMEETTVIFYVPPHGLKATLEDLEAVLGGQRRAVVSRELTKLHEEFFRGTVSEALAEFSRREPKGEIVLLVEGGALRGGDGEASGSGGQVESADDPRVLLRAEALLASGMRLSEVAKALSVEMKVNRKELYSVLIERQLDRGATQGAADRDSSASGGGGPSPKGSGGRRKSGSGAVAKSRGDSGRT